MTTSSIFLILMLFIFPVIISFTNMKKHINFLNYMTLCIKYTFFISLIPFSSFFNSDTN